MEGPPARRVRVVSRGQLLHYELWRTPGKLGAPIPFNLPGPDAPTRLPRPPAQPLNCSRRVAYLRAVEKERALRAGSENARPASRPAARRWQTELQVDVRPDGRRETGLQVDVTRLGPNRSAAARDEETAMVSPASTVFSVLSEAKSNGRVDVRLLDKHPAAHTLR